GHRNRRGWWCCNHRSTGDRAVDAGDQMAHADELAEIARYTLWRCRDDGQGGWRGDRQQVSDSAIRWWRDCTGTTSSGCRTKWHRRDRPHRIVLLFWQGPDLHLRLSGAVWT